MAQSLRFASIATGTIAPVRLFAVPDEQDVFDAQLALIVEAGESQCVTAARKSIDSVFFASRRGDTTCAVDSNCIAFDGIGAPCIPPVIAIEVDIERAVILDRPDRSKGIGPRPGDRGWTRALIVGAGVTKRGYNCNQ